LKSEIRNSEGRGISY